MRFIANWWRKKHDKPILFDFARALQRAQADADTELAKLEDPKVAVEVALWEHEEDPTTDELSC